jgi:hypothetical protein
VATCFLSEETCLAFDAQMVYDFLMSLVCREDNMRFATSRTSVDRRTVPFSPHHKWSSPSDDGQGPPKKDQSSPNIVSVSTNRPGMAKTLKHPLMLTCKGNKRGANGGYSYYYYYNYCSHSAVW